MKFDIVIGNPPYNRGIDIDFIFLAKELSNGYVSMITPAKWQTADAEQRIASEHSYGDFRECIVPHIKNVCYYPDCLDVFCITEISGISSYLIDVNNTYIDKCTVENKCALQKYMNSTYVRDISLQQSLWNIGNDVVSNLVSNFQNYPKLKINNVPYCNRYCILMSTQSQKQLGQSGAYDWENKQIDRNYLGKGGVAFNRDGKSSVIGTTQLAISEIGSRPKEEAKEKIVIFTSNNKEECESYDSYINSKLVKFLVFITISSMRTANSNSFRFVPMPLYGKFDHIYTDKEIYQMFKVPQEHIDIIESIIKDRK